MCRHLNISITICKLNPTANAGEDGSSLYRIFDLEVPDYTQVLRLSRCEHFLLWIVFSMSLEKLTRVSTIFGPGHHLKPVLGFFRCFSLAQSSWGDAALHSRFPCHSSKKTWWSATGHTERLKAEAPSQRRFKNVCAQVKDFLMF